jgi:histidyl-tRNA synthetase
MTEVVEKFGYENYTASPLEYTALFEAKSGREIVEKETYNLIDRGGREVTLRPEMTPTIARMIAAKNREIPRPIR